MIVSIIFAVSLPDVPALDDSVEYVLGEEVYFVLAEDGSARLLDFGGDFLALSQSGAELLRLVLQSGTTVAIREAAAAFGVDKQRIAADLNSLLADLARRRLIRRRDSFAIRFRLRRAVAFGVTNPLLWGILLLARSPRSQVWAFTTAAYLSSHLFGWGTTIAVWQQFFRSIDSDGWMSDNRATPTQIDDMVRDVASRHLFGVACKERSLCCWGMLRARGLPARLIVGVDLYPLASHCWCELGSTILTDFQDRCAAFTPILSYE